MIGEPWFWRERTLAARAARAALAPASFLYDGAQRLRWAATTPSRAPVPVLCIGNATLGGVGKTPFAILVATRLAALGRKPFFLTRGYGGALPGPVMADPDRHGAEDIGDEALLLAAAAPTIVSRDRPKGAALAAAKGAGVIVMDDGFQNPTLEKTFSFLLADAREPALEGAIFPAGPNREPFERAAARAGALVLVGREGDAGGAAALAGERPLFRAFLEPNDPPEPGKAVAFCGIGRPERFFAMLEQSGFELAARHPFPDHHRYAEAELARLAQEAQEAGARLITTEKDFARLPKAARKGVETFPVRMRIDNEAALDGALIAALESLPPQEQTNR